MRKVKRSDGFELANKSNKVLLVETKNRVSDLMVLFNICEQDEIAPGHEGAQLGVNFKKVNEDYKFSGIETIP